jgi:phage tail sheath protein FI
MLEPATATAHILVLPGIREPLICNYAARKVEEYGKAIYLMDLPHYSKDGIRLYDEKVDANKKPDVTNTIVKLSSRNFDNNYVASYFPDVMLEDASDPVVGAVVKRTLKCPSSIVALGALARSEGNSRSIQPWFAPAGFENGLNTRIKGVNVRLRADDRDDLYEARINPIATFPSNQYVIFGQKTLQVANTALNRVNVRRLMIEIKRGVERYAQRLLFEPNSAAVRNDFAAKVNALLSGIQRNSGIENFRVVINNDPNEADQNILSGKIIVVPTRVVEFIAMDFIVTNSGVTFA